MKQVLILLVLCFPLKNDLSAGVLNDPEPLSDTESTVWLGVWTAYSPVSVPLLATMRNARLTLFGFDVRHTSFQIREQQVILSSEAIILGHTEYPVNGISGLKDTRTGMGLLPLRITLPLYEHSPGNFLHLETGTGFLFFDKPYPNRFGALLNVIVDIGVGYNIRLSERTSISAGYRLQHISNGGSGQINPGIDSNLFILSLRSGL